jgi:nitric oxide dioxygenase
MRRLRGREYQVALNAKQIKEVQASYELVRGRRDEFAELFYQRLFELDPALRELFKSDLSSQQMKLLQTLEIIVTTLDHLEPNLDSIKGLGHKHVGYGVRPEQYSTAGAAWLWALDRVLGDDCTMEAKLAWTAAFCALAEIMLDGAAKVQPTFEPSALHLDGQSAGR